MVSRVAEIANKAATMADITNFISCDEIFLGYGLIGGTVETGAAL